MNSKISKILERLSEDDLDFLGDLGHQRKMQPKDGCADPVFWMIQDEKSVYCEDGEYLEFYDDGEMVYSTYHCNTEEDLEEFKKYILDYKDLDDDEKKELKDINNDEDLVEWFEVSSVNISFARFTREHYITEGTGPFLTKEAAKEHLKENDYYYSKNARTYGMVGWRNPQFERLMEIIEKLGDIDE